MFVPKEYQARSSTPITTITSLTNHTLAFSNMPRQNIVKISYYFPILRQGNGCAMASAVTTISKAAIIITSSVATIETT